MSKELVISSNRHETKVAMLEDDQLVEILFQRSDEYSLAGSIHKGRVTRVLPGMQSAFVDLGLERDTFLYVSDFFEESDEEFERIAPAEEPVPERRPERPGRLDLAEAVAEAVPEAPRPAESPAAAVPAPARTVRPEPAERAEEDRDRRGRRSRRRRGRGSRGFPESKYASDVASRPEPAAAAEPEKNQTGAEDLLVLPGESLAKYSRGRSSVPELSGQDENAPGAPGAAESIGGDERIAAGEAREVHTTPAFGEEPEPLAAFPETAFVAPEAVPPAAEPETAQLVPDEAAAGEAAEESQPFEDAGNRDLAELVDDFRLDEELGRETDAEPDAPLHPDRLPADRLPAEAQEQLSEAPQDAVGAASLRDQSSRYLHHANRRMRRKVRTPLGAAVPPVLAPRPQRPQERERPAAPSITEMLKEGQEIIVQIAKEPLGQKGARITSHIALPGRYVVYMPTVEHLGVSRKVASDQERTRLKRILQTHGAGMTGGFIVRTAGEGASEAEIAADMSFLYNLWLDIRQKAEKKPAPVLLHHDLDIVQRTLRDQLSEEFKSVWVDNEEVYESVLRFISRFQPALVNRVKLYTRPQHIFDAFNITPELEKGLRPKVWLKSGGYIVINQTEALVAIDINTGKYVGKSNRLEDTIVKTNLEAVREIVRQVRLRDLGGIIVVDFIDMDERKNRQRIMQSLEEAMRADRAPYKILAFNDFGLVAITRKRVKQSLERALCSACPVCEGAGYVKSVHTVVGEILQEAMKLRKAVAGNKDALLRVSPEVAKFLKSHRNTYLEEIEEVLGRPALVSSDPTIHPEKFDLA
ncbi:MAG: Rne/Rng family ribonuclease [Acidobacteria bacterium]|nr:Rne/Rng family ribonuclease [Acidobacteriota bacterium]